MLSRILLFAALAFGACTNAQSIKKETKKETKAKSPKLEKGLAEVSEDAILYRLEGNGLKEPSYIYGTMHMIDAEKFYFPKELRKLISKQDQFIMELESVGNQMEMMAKLMLPADQKLADFFTPEQYDSIKVYFKENMNMEPAMFDMSFSRMKPFVVLQTMTALPFTKKKIESYDNEIYGIAEKHDIKIHGLETIDQQLGFFDEMETDDMAKMIMSSMVDTDTSTLLDRMETAYQNQSLKDLGTIMTSDESFMDTETLLDGRNIKWVPQIMKLTKDKSCFVAVGAGHLFGEKGILTLLKNEGYTITPLKMIAKHEK